MFKFSFNFEVVIRTINNTLSASDLDYIISVSSLEWEAIDKCIVINFCICIITSCYSNNIPVIDWVTTFNECIELNYIFNIISYSSTSEIYSSRNLIEVVTFKNILISIRESIHNTRLSASEVTILNYNFTSHNFSSSSLTKSNCIANTTSIFTVSIKFNSSTIHNY